MGSFDKLWRNVWTTIWWRVAMLVSIGLLAASGARSGLALSMASYALMLPASYFAGRGANAELRGENEVAAELASASSGFVFNWSRLFGCSREELIRPTTKVGPLVADLEWDLGFRRRPNATIVD